MTVLSYYKDLNHYSSNCLIIGSNDTGISGYFANVCMKTSIDAINSIEARLKSGKYKKEEYVCTNDPIDIEYGHFDTRKGLSI